MAIVVGPTRWNASLRDPYVLAAINCPLGTTLSDGSSLICKNLGVAFFVAPSASEVGREWTARNDAVTTAQACTGRTGWFVPSCSQLRDVGYCCRSFWNSYASANYWSSTSGYIGEAWHVSFIIGNVVTYGMTTISCVRAFRCVTY